MNRDRLTVAVAVERRDFHLAAAETLLTETPQRDSMCNPLPPLPPTLIDAQKAQAHATLALALATMLRGQLA